MRAYHFVGATLRDGSPVPPDGVTLRHTGALVLCQSGYHASLDPFDALAYAPGDTLCLVGCGGRVTHGDDKLVCTGRTIIRRADMSVPLRYFARMCALSVINYYPDVPDVVLDWLMTGDESLRASAYSAASSAVASSASASSAASSAVASSAAYSAVASSAAYSAVASSAAYRAAYSAAYSAAAAYDNAEYSAARAWQREEFNQIVKEAGL